MSDPYGLYQPYGDGHSGSSNAPVSKAINAGMDCSIADLTSRQRVGGEQPLITLTSTYKRPRTDDMRWRGRALRVIRHLSTEDVDIKTELEIASPPLQKAMRLTMSSDSSLNLQADPIVIQKPYASLFHGQSALVQYAQAPERTPEEKRHMELLTKDFYDKYLRHSVKQYQAGARNGVVIFPHLWMLFVSGEDILVTTPHYRQIHRVRACFEEQSPLGPKFTIATWRWGYNAGKFGPCSAILEVPSYSEARKIEQLPYYPLSKLEEAQRKAIERELVTRGHKWKSLIRPSCKYYEGWAWAVSSAHDFDPHAQIETLRNVGRIMLDQDLFSEAAPLYDDELLGVQGYRFNMRAYGQTASSISHRYSSFRSAGRMHPSLSTSSACKITMEQADCHLDDNNYRMTDDQALLAPARTKGFSLTEKKFAWFLVDGISEPDFAEGAFRSVAIPAASKSLIMELAQHHSVNKHNFDDMVKGKGHGMVISLEGPPGSGKTLTAESVAELTHRPFYPMGTGELSTDARGAEIALRAIFKRGERWNAVVLLDEADLFLAKRTPEDLERNALVNVFLRNLEYFRGLLFLTSNRVEEFDPAFNSRIHLHVQYQEPDATIRAEIWRHFMPKNWPDSVAERLGKDLEINGRDIKSLMRTAVLLGQGTKHTLSEDLIHELHGFNFQNLQKAPAMKAQGVTNP